MKVRDVYLRKVNEMTVHIVFRERQRKNSTVISVGEECFSLRGLTIDMGLTIEKRIYVSFNHLTCIKGEKSLLVKTNTFEGMLAIAYVVSI